MAKYPALLVGGQIDAKEPRRWLFIEQECAVPSVEGGSGRWAIDHLFIDQDAIPTIVEVKRSTDTRIRREVVGQMLDYAANSVAYWPVAQMRERFAANCQACGVDPEEKRREFLEDESEPEEFWRLADKNLREHKIRLLFVADVIPTELQRIVEFLNDQMDQTEVLAIEIKQFVAEQGLRSLVPRVIGQTTAAKEKKSVGPRSGRQWDELAILETIVEKRGVEVANVARRLIDWSKQNVSHINWGKGANDGSFSPVLDYGAAYDLIPFRVYTYGNAEILFNRLAERHNTPFDSEEKRLELLKRLNEIPGIDLPTAGINRRPSISLEALTVEESYLKFQRTIEWVVEEVKAANQQIKTRAGSIDV